MKLSKGTYQFIFIAAFVVVVGGVILYFVFRDPPVEDPNKNGTPVPPGSPSTKWIPEYFPLNLSMFGDKIRALQKALGFTGTAIDGKLGTNTRDAIIAKGYAFPLSQTDYNKIINPPVTGGGTNFAQLKAALGTKALNNPAGDGVYTGVSGENVNYSFTFFTNGRMSVRRFSDNKIWKGSYHSGGKEINIDAVDGGFDADESTVFIAMKEIVNQIEE